MLLLAVACSQKGEEVDDRASGGSGGRNDMNGDGDGDDPASGGGAMGGASSMSGGAGGMGGLGVGGDTSVPLFTSCEELVAWTEDNTSEDEFVFYVQGSRIELPLVSNGEYDFKVDWGDGRYGSITGPTDKDSIHLYEEDSFHLVRIRGDVLGWAYAPHDDELGGNEDLGIEWTNLELAIAQWGRLQLGDTKRQFAGTDIRLCAKDAPDLSQTVSLSEMFLLSSFPSMCRFEDDSNDEDCDQRPDLTNWNVSNITDMSTMFLKAKTFNGDLSSWDVSSVTTMRDMFNSAEAFDGDLSLWDVSKVKNMSGMFEQATSFNGDLSAWDVSNLKLAKNMFSSAESFNGDLSSWDVASVVDMQEMFTYAYSFNGDLSSWDVSNVSDMADMFSFASSFAGDLASWNISNVRYMDGILTRTAQSKENYDALLVEWSALSVQSGITFRTDAQYSAGVPADARASLVEAGWSIFDGGQAP